MPLTMEVSINSSKWDRLFTGPNFTENSKAGLQNVISNMKAHMIGKNLIPVNRGALRNSINASSVVSADGLSAQFGSPFPYAIVMEKGRRPGKPKPPLGPLMKWANDKFKSSVAGEVNAVNKRQKASLKREKDRLKEFKKTGKFTGEFPTLRSPEKKGDVKKRILRGIAFALQNKIARDGIKVPLTSSGRGGMFGRTFKAVQSKISTWYSTGFLRAAQKKSGGGS